MFPNEVIDDVLKQYGLLQHDFEISPVGSGYIHHTFKLSGKKDLILQRVNKNVFKHPEVIASNLKEASDHLSKHYPDYLFLTAVPTLSGKQMAYDQEGYPWRIFPFFENTYTTDKVDSAAQAFSAAAEFARLVCYLDDVAIDRFKPTIERFHDLAWRYEQFEDALKDPVAGRIVRANIFVEKAKSYRYLVDEYLALTQSGGLKLRITHNDTKINNILFDAHTHRATCAIDLDTLMPGYVMYDIGDMIRTFVSPVDEEEQDLEKIKIREGIYSAIVAGYLSQMEGSMSETEKKSIHYSGMMMTYIMALRMLTDYLNGDIYYKIRYEGQNLIRAKNQFRLLDLLKDLEPRMSF